MPATFDVMEPGGLNTGMLRIEYRTAKARTPRLIPRPRKAWPRP